MSFLIMAGGSGTRFWPLSRKSRPKQLLRITSHEPMIMETYKRIKPLCPNDSEIFIITGKQHEDGVFALFHHSGVNIVVEPFGRNTAPCIGLGALLASCNNLEEAMVILPSDHYIGKPEVFRKDIEKAIHKANRSECIVTIGITPTRPETGYGYIEIGEQEDVSLYRVKSFVEKPDIKTAEAYLASGFYLWNAGIFVAKPAVILKEMSLLMPEFYEGLMKIKPYVKEPSFPEKLKELYRQAPNISFDYAIMEKTKLPIFVVSSDCAWSDVGSWYSLYQLKTQKEDENIYEGNVIFMKSSGNFVVSKTDRFIAVLGLKNVLVVDVDDALLIADMNYHQDVKAITEHLEKIGKEDLL